MSNAFLKSPHGAAKQYCRSKIGVQGTHFFFLAAIALAAATCSVAIDVVDTKKTLTTRMSHPTTNLCRGWIVSTLDKSRESTSVVLPKARGAEANRRSMETDEPAFS